MSNGNVGDVHRRLELIAQAFSPSAPVTREQLFRGRIDEMVQLQGALYGSGEHAVIFGERGVGKTSLARTVSALSAGSPDAGVSVFTTCDSADTYSSIWRKVADDLLDVAAIAERSNQDAVNEAAVSAGYILLDGLEEDQGLGPNHVRRSMRVLSTVGRAAVFIDEFDRLADTESVRLIADTVKVLSDHSIDATIVLVGVANSVGDLIAEHESVGRALTEIPMPRMTNSEIESILTQGFDHVGLTYDSEAVGRMTSLALGMPHFAHLLGKSASEDAVLSGLSSITPDHLEVVISNALRKSNESVKQLYLRATQSNRPGTLYGDVLLAASLTVTDESGYFAPSDVRDPMRVVTGRSSLEVANFNRHLAEFASSEPPRGGTLDRVGGERRYRYRFANPLLQPYVVLKAAAENRIAYDEEAPGQFRVQLVPPDAEAGVQMSIGNGGG